MVYEVNIVNIDRNIMTQVFIGVAILAIVNFANSIVDFTHVQADFNHSADKRSTKLEIYSLDTIKKIDNLVNTISNLNSDIGEIEVKVEVLQNSTANIKEKVKEIDKEIASKRSMNFNDS